MIAMFIKLYVVISYYPLFHKINIVQDFIQEKKLL